MSSPSVGATELRSFHGSWRAVAIAWAAGVVVVHLFLRDFLPHDLLYLPALSPGEIDAPTSDERRGAGDLLSLFAAAFAPILAYLAAGLSGPRYTHSSLEKSKGLTETYTLGALQNDEKTRGFCRTRRSCCG